MTRCRLAQHEAGDPEAGGRRLVEVDDERPGGGDSAGHRDLAGWLVGVARVRLVLLTPARWTVR